MSRVHIHPSFVITLCLILSGLLVSPASARRYRHGPDEALHVIVKTGVVSSDGAALFVCYKTYTYYLLAGLYTNDELVLCEGETKRYWALPPAAELASMQKAGLLPDPLPTYRRPVLDYVIGYSFWLILAALLPLSLLLKRRKKSANKFEDTILRSATRRVMARMIVGSPHSIESSTALARQIFAKLFNEPMREEEFAADLTWVRNEPAAYDGFIAAAGRKFDGPTKLGLLRVAAAIVMVDGTLEHHEEEAISQLANRFGVSQNDTRGLVENLRRQQQQPAPA